MILHNMEEQISQHDVDKVATAAAIAKEAVEVARNLAAKTDQANIKFAESLAVTSQSVLALDLKFGFLQSTLNEIKDIVLNKYVTIEAFKPVRSLVYGMVSLMLASIVGGIMTLIIIK